MENHSEGAVIQQLQPTPAFLFLVALSNEPSCQKQFPINKHRRTILGGLVQQTLIFH